MQVYDLPYLIISPREEAASSHGNPQTQTSGNPQTRTSGKRTNPCTHICITESLFPHKVRVKIQLHTCTHHKLIQYNYVIRRRHEQMMFENIESTYI